MASPDLESPCLSSVGGSFHGFFNIHMEEGNTADILHVLEAPTSSASDNCNIPTPPPLPSKPCTKSKSYSRNIEYTVLLKETKNRWDILFTEGNGADVHIITEDKSFIPAHSFILVS